MDSDMEESKWTANRAREDSGLYEKWGIRENEKCEYGGNKTHVMYLYIYYSRIRVV